MYLGIYFGEKFSIVYYLSDANETEEDFIQNLALRAIKFNNPELINVFVYIVDDEFKEKLNSYHYKFFDYNSDLDSDDDELNFPIVLNIDFNKYPILFYDSLIEHKHELKKNFSHPEIDKFYFKPIF